MKSLFLRIFLWFCGTTAVISCIIGAGFVLHFPEALTTNWRSLGQGSLVAVARTAVETYERGGVAALAGYFQSVKQDADVQPALFDASGRDVAGSSSSPRSAITAELASRPESELVVFPRRRMAAVRLRAPSGAAYVFTAVLPPRERGVWGRRYLVLVIFAGGVFCFLLARHVSAPVTHLRAATARFSGGDFTTRITLPGVLKRKDEIGGLARDFNQMAARIETLMRAQQRLIADVSHELRSPITRLGLALGLLRQRGESDPRSSVARMERELERLNTLIAQLLTLSRLEALVEPPPMESIDLSALVQEIVADADFEATCLERGVRLVECAACSMNAARDLLRSAVENVVRNAVRYTEPNTQVLVRLQRTNGDRTANIVVEDHGPGVPDAALPHLFEPFYRADEARDRGSGGAGLGLAISRRIVTLHGGSIRAANRDAGGLELRITLPVQSVF